MQFLFLEFLILIEQILISIFKNCNFDLNI